MYRKTFEIGRSSLFAIAENSNNPRLREGNSPFETLYGKPVIGNLSGKGVQMYVAGDEILTECHLPLARILSSLHRYV